MRIISGKFKGKKILQPKDKETRPLKDLAKESIFNIINHSNKFKINILPEDILEINTMEAPILISDEYFGEVEVFYKKITKSFFINSLTRKITVKYQGCNEKGFCYPLISKELILKNGEIFINKGT